eukprot:SAG11_NODE_9538_length_902_cov_1.509340_1_plen_127_part_00
MAEVRERLDRAFELLGADPLGCAHPRSQSPLIKIFEASDRLRLRLSTNRAHLHCWCGVARAGLQRLLQLDEAGSAKQLGPCHRAVFDLCLGVLAAAACAAAAAARAPCAETDLSSQIPESDISSEV